MSTEFSCKELKEAIDKGALNIVQKILISNPSLISISINNNMTPFLYACAKGNLGTVLFLLTDTHFDKCTDSIINQTTPNNENGLHIAAWNGHSDIVKYLLNKTDLNFRKTTSGGDTPLHHAAENGHTQTIITILKNALFKFMTSDESLFINARNSKGETALMVAANNVKKDTLEAFLYLKDKACAEIDDTDRTLIFLAAARKNWMKVFLDILNIRDFQEKINILRDGNGNTALLLAAQNGNLEMVQYLLTKAEPKADIHQPNNAGESALALAAWKEHLPMVQYLLSQGAYIDSKDKKNRTPKEDIIIQGAKKAKEILEASETLLSLADLKEIKESRENKKTIDALMSIIISTLGVGLNARSLQKNGNTALHLALINNNFSLFILLLKKGANPDIENHNKKTVRNLATEQFLIAVKSGDCERLKVLLESNLIEAKLIKEQFILTAAKGDLKSLITLLNSNQVDINHRDENGSTALHWAAQEGHLEVVKYLLTDEQFKVKAEINQSNNSGMTALHYAAKNGRKNIVQFLVDCSALSNKIDVRTYEGNTALILAAVEGHTEIVKILLTDSKFNTKANIHLKNNAGHTALLMATPERIETIKFLLTTANPKSDISDVDSEKNNILMDFICCKNIEMVQFLLVHGVFIDITNKSGKTPIKMAKDLDFNFAIKLLESAEKLLEISDSKENNEDAHTLIAQLGPCLNARSKKRFGNTALHCAVNNKNYALCTQLLSAGASIHIKNDAGKTAFELFSEHNHQLDGPQSEVLFAKFVKIAQLPQNATQTISGTNQSSSSETKKIEEQNQSTSQVLASQEKNNESLNLAIEEHLDKLYEEFEKLSEAEKQKRGLEMASLFIYPLTDPPNAVAGYKILKQINKDNPHYKRANELLYRLFLGDQKHQHLKLAKLGNTSKEDTVVKENKTKQERKVLAESLDENESELIPVNPNSEHGLIVSEEDSLKAMVQHFVYADIKDEPFKNFLAIHLYGEKAGFSSEMDKFHDYRDPDSFLFLLEKMRKVIKGHEEQSQRAEELAQRAEKLEQENAELRKKIEALEKEKGNERGKEKEKDQLTKSLEKDEEWEQVSSTSEVMQVFAPAFQNLPKAPASAASKPGKVSITRV